MGSGGTGSLASVGAPGQPVPPSEVALAHGGRDGSADRAGGRCAERSAESKMLNASCASPASVSLTPASCDPSPVGGVPAAWPPVDGAPPVADSL